jgi:hypothetical protein
MLKERKGLRKESMGFVWFGPTSKVVKKVCEPYDRIQQRSKILLS